MHHFSAFLQLVGLMTAASALPIGVMEHNPTTELTVMAAGMFIFWAATMLRRRGTE